jgi:hypothetical protein
MGFFFPSSWGWAAKSTEQSLASKDSDWAGGSLLQQEGSKMSWWCKCLFWPLGHGLDQSARGLSSTPLHSPNPMILPSGWTTFPVITISSPSSSQVTVSPFDIRKGFVPAVVISCKQPNEEILDDSLTGVEIVPVPRRSPVRSPHPGDAWCANICAGDQYSRIPGSNTALSFSRDKKGGLLLN